MDAQELAVRLIIDGVVVVPDVVAGQELEAMRAAFESRAAQLGRRGMDWEDICLVPQLMSYICHPRLIAVVSSFMDHFGHETVFTNSAGIRDVYAVYDKDKKESFDPTDLRHAPVGWHDDVIGVTNPTFCAMRYGLTSLLYLDETFADNGAYCTAISSHHLAYADLDDKPIIAAGETVLDHCKLRALPVKPGSVIIHRAHNWHGVMPVKQQRRVMLQTFGTRMHYDLQIGHTQISTETLALIPPDRHKHVCWYKKAEPQPV